MFTRFKNFLYGISVNRLSRLGIALTTSSFILFIIMQLAMFTGILVNAYVGLIAYLLFPSLIIIGLVLIPIGLNFHKRDTGRTIKEILKERFNAVELESGVTGSKVFRTILILTIFNILFLGIASNRMLNYMDGSHFCGTACHSVMSPEWTTYQASPHARVKCVECHVGEGAGALINSKLNGTWQMISVTLDLFERPIPTPVHQLRPARETCEKCHWPDKFYGNRLKTIVSYQRDSLSTPEYTTLGMKIDSGTGTDRRGIHWHVAQENEIRYISVDDEREKMLWVEVNQPGGGYKRYTNKEYPVQPDENKNIRNFDCVDCHNRATHVYEDPQKAVNERINLGLLDRSLPYLSREALHAIIKNYPDSNAAMDGIANHLRGFYKRNYPKLAATKIAAIDSSVHILQDIYNRNIHPQMNISWGSYPSHIGHKGESGCFRCHNPRLVDDENNSIPYDCVLCHSIPAYESSEPFKFLSSADTTDRDYMMHRYLQQEFLDSYPD
ncbi:MAG: cytochrome C [candidate division Zixibacteria bacterium]|nr:cytochrome C [candidate division Zixibacteria bacterium]